MTTTRNEPSDQQLLTWLQANATTAQIEAAVKTREGRIVELDLHPIGEALGDYNEALIEALHTVEVLTVHGTRLRKLDLIGFTQLRVLRVGAAARELLINVADCKALETIEKLPYEPSEAEDATRVYCRSDQLAASKARAMEKQGRAPHGMTLLFEFIDGDLSGKRRVSPVSGDVLAWLSRHPGTDLATILASYWHESPWFWAQFDDESQLRSGERATYRMLRAIEAKVEAGFFTSRMHSFDVNDAQWSGLSITREESATYKRDVPAFMFKVEADVP